MQITRLKAQSERPLRPGKAGFGSSAFYTWDVPGAPRVELHLNVVDGIVRDIAKLPGQWSDTAGVLLGRRKNSEGQAVIIEDYASLPAPRRWQAGAYTDAENTALKTLLERWRPAGGRRIEAVGLFRSGLMGAPSLTEEDVQLFDRWFPQPEAVFLFISVSRGRLQARFLSRDEDGRLLPSAGKPSFPFSRRELGEAADPGVAPSGQQRPARAEFSQDEERDASRLPGAEGRPVLGQRAAWIIGGAVTAGLVALGALEYRAIPVPAVQEAAARPAQDGAWLDLRAERVGAQWQLRWNRQATIVQSASHGRLEIVDGEYRKDLALDVNDLRSGYLVYAPMTDEVSFRLDVFDSTHQRTLGESVRAAAGGFPASAGRRAPRAEYSDGRGENVFGAARDLMPGAAPAAREYFSAPREESYSDRSEKTDSLPLRPPMGSALAARPVFTPPAAGAEVLVARQKVAALALTTPPAVSSQNAAAPSSLPPAPLISPPPPPAAAPQANPQNVPANPAGSAPAATAGPEVVPAVLITRTAPKYPFGARAAGVSGAVKVTATIDVNGRTKDIRAESGPIPLRSAAIDAVRGFVYVPAKLHGRPVESSASIQVNFKLDQ